MACSKQAVKDGCIMKKLFSTAWKGSSQARKQRKFRFNAPLHIKQKFMSANLSKDLRKTVGRRSLELRKDDTVKILIGKFKGKRGKILTLNMVRQKVSVEGIQATKKDGSKVSIPLHPSNLQIVELNTSDKKRLNVKKKEDKKKEALKENKETKK
jgi:large subunit ribosomal protein L24